MESLNPTLTKFEISREIWATLLSMHDPEIEDKQLYIHPSESSYLHISFLKYQDDHRAITDSQAKRYIRLAVQKSLDQHQKVFLYYCPDNQEISIEHLSEDEDLSLFDQISDNYYEGKD